MVLGCVGVFCLLSLLEYVFTGYPLGRLSSLSVHEAREIVNGLNVKLNQTLAVTFVVVGMAVPLTANMYSLKVLEFFVRNPVNLIALVFIVFANLSGIWVSYSLKSTVLPIFQIYLLFVLTALSLLILLPFLIYLFRFLHPNTLLNLLEKEARSCLKAALRSGEAGHHRKRVAETLEHIANISVRSVDRSDRSTAIEGIVTLERLGRNYWSVKDKLSPAWFEADPNSFLGFSSLAVEEMVASRSWVEMKLYNQFFEALRAASPRMPELTSTIGESLRKLGLETISQKDIALRELTMEYFNTFIRLAINHRDIRSVFILFDQYRYFAEMLNDQFPDQVTEIAYYFQYYGEVAREQQLPFVVEALAHDFRMLVQKAWERGAPNSQELLEQFLHFDQAGAVLPGVRKAQALLGSYFLYTCQPEPVKLIRQSFRGMSVGLIETLREDLLQVTRQKYWEVSERRMNIEFVPAPQREKLKEFFASLADAPSS
jgi:hypothetical protein